MSDGCPPLWDSHFLSIDYGFGRLPALSSSRQFRAECTIRRSLGIYSKSAGTISMMSRIPRATGFTVGSPQRTNRWNSRCARSPSTVGGTVRPDFSGDPLRTVCIGVGVPISTGYFRQVSTQGLRPNSSQIQVSFGDVKNPHPPARKGGLVGRGFSLWCP